MATVMPAQICQFRIPAGSPITFRPTAQIGGSARIL